MPLSFTTGRRVPIAVEETAMAKTIACRMSVRSKISQAARNATVMEITHVPIAARPERPRIDWRSISQPARRKSMPSPSSRRRLTAPSECARSSTCGPMTTPKTSMNTTPGTRFPVAKLSSGLRSPAIMIHMTETISPVIVHHGPFIDQFPHGARSYRARCRLTNVE